MVQHKLDAPFGGIESQHDSRQFNEAHDRKVEESITGELRGRQDQSVVDEAVGKPVDTHTRTYINTHTHTYTNTNRDIAWLPSTFRLIWTT